MGKNTANPLAGELRNLEGVALDAYKTLLPDAIDPAVDALYAAPNATILWRSRFSERTDVSNDGLELLVRPDKQTHIRIEKNWWGHHYTQLSLSFRGRPPTQIPSNEGEVMFAKTDPVGLEYRFWHGNNFRPGDWFSREESVDPADRENDPRLILVDYLSAAVLDAAQVAPPLQREFALDFQRASGYEPPKNYGGRFPERPNRLLREIEDMGAVAASPTTAVYLNV